MGDTPGAGKPAGGSFRRSITVLLDKLGTPILTGVILALFGIALAPRIAERLQKPTCDNPRGLTALEAVTAHGDSLPPDTFPNKGYVNYSPSNLVDGNSSTAWVEGLPGLGVGASVRLEFGRVYDVRLVCVVNGYAESWDLYSKNSRVRQLEVQTEQGVRISLLRDTGSRDRPAEYQALNIAAGPTRHLEMTLRSAYAAQAPASATSGYADTSLSEVEVWIPG